MLIIVLKARPSPQVLKLGLLVVQEVPLVDHLEVLRPLDLLVQQLTVPGPASIPRTCRKCWMKTPP